MINILLIIGSSPTIPLFVPTLGGQHNNTVLLNVALVLLLLILVPSLRYDKIVDGDERSYGTHEGGNCREHIISAAALIFILLPMLRGLNLLYSSSVPNDVSSARELSRFRTVHPSLQLSQPCSVIRRGGFSLDERLNPFDGWLDVLKPAKALNYEPSSREQEECYRRFVEFDDSGGELLRLVLNIDATFPEFDR